ncbi:MAG: ACP S-malonyltransferase, partial [Clostridia bacterium]|nr:ACP S-malonyltransferase [Clostridia bacterium]
FSPEEGFSLVLKRAEYMAEASERMPGTPAMAAVMRLSPEEIENLCAGIDGVFPANYNAPEQTVISGTAEGVAAFKALAAERGLSARTVDLPVSGAFHTPFMATASERLLPVLEAVTFSRPRVPVRANLTGELYPEDPAGYPAILSAQIRNPVRWTDEIRAMIEAGADTFVECGPGKTLCGLIRKIDRNAAVYQAQDEETLAAAVKALGS